MSLAASSDRKVRELYEKGNEDAREELIRRGLLGCRTMMTEAEKSRKAFNQRPWYPGTK